MTKDGCYSKILATDEQTTYKITEDHAQISATMDIVVVVALAMSNNYFRDRGCVQQRIMIGIKLYRPIATQGQ